MGERDREGRETKKQRDRETERDRERQRDKETKSQGLKFNLWHHLNPKDPFGFCALFRRESESQM